MADKCVVCEVLEVIAFVVWTLPCGRWWRVVTWRVQELRCPSKACLACGMMLYAGCTH